MWRGCCRWWPDVDEDESGAAEGGLVSTGASSSWFTVIEPSGADLRRRRESRRDAERLWAAVQREATRGRTT